MLKIFCKFSTFFCLIAACTFASGAGRKPRASAATTNKLLRSYLEAVSFRHKILSQNLANLNTPGYKAEEVKMPKTIDDLTDKQNLRHRSVNLTATSNRHINGNKPFSSQLSVQKLKDPFEVKPNGNNVSLAQQVTKVSQNQLAYDAALKAYVSNNALVSIVLGK